MADAKTTKTAESTGSAAAWEAPKQKVKTLDSSDYDLGWTNQAAVRPAEPPEANPVTLAKNELPDDGELAAQGIDAETFKAYFTNVAE